MLWFLFLVMNEHKEYHPSIKTYFERTMGLNWPRMIRLISSMPDACHMTSKIRMLLKSKIFN